MVLCTKDGGLDEHNPYALTHVIYVFVIIHCMCPFFFIYGLFIFSLILCEDFSHVNKEDSTGCCPRFECP